MIHDFARPPTIPRNWADRGTARPSAAGPGTQVTAQTALFPPSLCSLHLLVSQRRSTRSAAGGHVACTSGKHLYHSGIKPMSDSHSLGSRAALTRCLSNPQDQDRQGVSIPRCQDSATCSFHTGQPHHFWLHDGAASIKKKKKKIPKIQKSVGEKKPELTSLLGPGSAARAPR